MYAVIKTGGHQEKVEVGQILRVDLTEEEVGSEIQFPSVLLVADGKEIQVGTPLVKGALVKGEVLAEVKDDKVIIFKMKRRQRYRRTRGHRQQYLEVVITEINSGKKVAKAEEQALVRARARTAALAAEKNGAPKMTRAQKIAADIPKPRSKKQVRRDQKSAVVAE